MHVTDNYFQTQAFDKFPFYPATAVMACGVIQILMGLLSMALGVGSICTLSSGWFIAYGIWCGFMFTVTGGICIGSAIRKSGCMIFSTLVLSIIVSCLAGIQFSLGIVAADNDSVMNRKGILNFEPMPQEYDIYSEKNNPWKYYCTGENNRFNWQNSWGPVDVLLLLAGFIELVAAVSVSILGCHAACCGKRIPSIRYFTYQTGTGGFSNEAYMTESRLSPAPPLYKLAA